MSEGEKSRRLPAASERPHLLAGDPANPYCARCGNHVRRLGRECRSPDLPNTERRHLERTL